MKFALVRLADQKILRHQEFDELPPLLASAKGMQWFALVDPGEESITHDPVSQNVKPDGVEITGRTVTRKYRVEDIAPEIVQAKVKKAQLRALEAQLTPLALAEAISTGNTAQLATIVQQIKALKGA